MKVTNKNRPKLTVVQPAANDPVATDTKTTEPKRDNRVHVPRVSAESTLKPGHFKYIAAAVVAALTLLFII